MTPEMETASAVTPELTPAAVSQEAPEADAPQTDDGAPSSHDADLRAIWARHNPARDEAGRFQSTKPQETAETEVLSGQAPTEEVKQAKPAIQPPQSWSADVKAKWEALPSDVQDYVLKREKESHEAITRQGQELKAYEPIRNVIEQFGDVFERNGVTPDDGIARLLAAERALTQNPYAAIAELAQAYGVDLTQYAGQQQQQPGSTAPETQALHRQIAVLTQQLDETTNRIHRREQAEADMQRESLTSLIARFSADKSDWADLENDIHKEIVGIKATVNARLLDAMTPEQMLQTAYERAQRNNPQAWARRQEAERKAEDEKRLAEAKKRAEDAKKAKAVNISGNPVNGASIRSMEDDLRASWRAAQSR